MCLAYPVLFVLLCSLEINFHRNKWIATISLSSFSLISFHLLSAFSQPSVLFLPFAAHHHLCLLSLHVHIATFCSSFFHVLLSPFIPFLPLSEDVVVLVRTMVWRTHGGGNMSSLGGGGGGGGNMSSLGGKHTLVSCSSLSSPLSSQSPLSPSPLPPTLLFLYPPLLPCITPPPLPPSTHNPPLPRLLHR